MTRRTGLSIAAVIAEIDAQPVMRSPVDPADDRRFDALCSSRQYRIVELRELRADLRSPPPRCTAHSRPSLASYRRMIRSMIRDRVRELKDVCDIGPRGGR